MTKYIKLEDGNYQIVETEEKVSVVNLDFIKADIEHKDKLIANLQEGITNLETEKAELIKIKNALEKL